jgi:hypothetical protein
MVAADQTGGVACPFVCPAGVSLLRMNSLRARRKDESMFDTLDVLSENVMRIAADLHPPRFRTPRWQVSPAAA